MCSELEEGIQSRRVSPVGSEAPAGSVVTGWRKEPQMEDSAVEGRMGHHWPCRTKGQLELLDTHRGTHRSTHTCTWCACKCVGVLCVHNMIDEVFSGHLFEGPYIN